MDNAATAARAFENIDEAMNYYNKELSEAVADFIASAHVSGTVATPAGLGSLNPDAKLS